MRYIFGPQFTRQVDPRPLDGPPPGTVDMACTLEGVSPAGVALKFDAPAAACNAPIEARVYLAPEGAIIPGTPDEWIGCPHPVAVAPLALTAAGGSVTTPLPAVPPGVYLGQVLLGFEA